MIERLLFIYLLIGILNALINFIELRINRVEYKLFDWKIKIVGSLLIILLWPIYLIVLIIVPLYQIIKKVF